ncbi:dolichyl-phosphate beta-glucosyltransferase [Xylographa opegraphella]|nr:dolichyl-phosphate beta-glucosyltransferase [Xylographa opegraphella]
MECFRQTVTASQSIPLPLLLLIFGSTLIGICVLSFLILFVVAPIPRPPTKAEKSFRCIGPDGKVSLAQQLPCWQDKYVAAKSAAQQKGDFSRNEPGIEPEEVFMSLVVPAYNEEDRLGMMLTEAVEYLEQEYGLSRPRTPENGSIKARMNGHSGGSNGHAVHRSTKLNQGWEVLIVSDGSTDKTIETALNFARDLGTKSSALIRVVSLQENRGKGGAVTHGLRHVRGKHAVFADADGASRFTDLGKLVKACEQVADGKGRGVAVGSRAHLVGSDEVVKRSFLRNFLMHSFHLFLRLLTPPATAAIRDTQCGFKLFSRPALPYIVPYMKCEGWIFDVEMLMLAESAGIPVAEVPVGWKEVKGSKLNVLWDSLGMAWSLAVLRAAWTFGVYRRS